MVYNYSVKSQHTAAISPLTELPPFNILTSGPKKSTEGHDIHSKGSTSNLPLQTAGSQQQASRINVKKGANGQEYEYEYIYYYDDDENLDNGKRNTFLNLDSIFNSMCFQRATALKICPNLWSPAPALLLPPPRPQLPLPRHPSLPLLGTGTGTCPQRPSLRTFPKGRKRTRRPKFPLATPPSTEDAVTTVEEVTASTTQQRSPLLTRSRRPLPSGKNFSRPVQNAFT
jgi:hypothetical protein